MSKLPPAQPLLTLEKLAGLRDKVSELKDLLTTTAARLEETQARFEAGLKFLPAGTNLDALYPPGTAKLNKRGGHSFSLATTTWRGAIMHVLNEAKRGLRHDEALAALKHTPIAPKLITHQRIYYKTVLKLTAEGVITRDGKLVYSTEVWKNIKENGPPTLPPPPVSHGKVHTPERIKQILRDHPEGLEIPAIADLLKKMPGVTKSVFKHDNYVHTQVGKLVKDEAVVKLGKVYRLRGTLEMKSGSVASTTDPLH
jgi:hypothetical protein